MLEVYLNKAQGLRAKDRAGTSDPYVKFKIANKVLFKSRIIYKELNPKFDEFLTLPIDNLLEPVQIKGKLFFIFNILTVFFNSNHF